ncbi:3-oxo-isoapionate-4-phosphate transcarboxylase/hydrolase [Baekduia alba]|uniref:RuBisCO large subunit C-terminal-like domain-containing protein n=1 Tax=Baekduia alba TaxID=2997333 RepID=UPI0023404C17|nr:RuBisCO large subunit C-terminal-like domain-containing protein [Baekduia alba]WCB95330.1 3-oxo-isoapionate-4-phosphate transcarboxylase/hydrolase [Baekduia alba]
MSGSTIIANYDIVAGDPEHAAAVLAGEGSTGTFVRVAGDDAAGVERFAIAVADLQATGSPDGAGRTPARLALALPEDLAGGDLTTLLASVAGNVSEVAQVSALRLVDLRLSDGFLRGCPRPRFGVDGTRRLLARREGPLVAGGVGATRRPTPDAVAAGVRSALARGVDVIRDPVPVADPAWCRLRDRVAAVERVLAEHRERHGRRALFTYTIDDEPAAMVVHAHLVVAGGGHAVGVRVAGVGLTAVAHLQRRTGVLIAARSAPGVALTRSARFGIADEALQAIWRLAGVDHLPVGAAHPDPAAGVRARLTPLLHGRDRALGAVAAGTAHRAEHDDILIEEEATT